MLNLSEVVKRQFRQAMQAAGIAYSDEIIPDGQLHRFHIEGHKKGSLNGSYRLHIDNRPAGYFQDFKSGISQKWRSSGNSYVSTDVIKSFKEANHQREIEARQKQEEAAKKAAEIWQKSKPVNNQADHPYLVKKAVQPYGARLYCNALAISIYNEGNRLVNLQFIDPEGCKRFLSGGRKHGCFYIIGDLSPRILIAEGFATGASLFKSCGQRVVIAFDAGNLLPVAKNIRELSPDSEIIICGDNDLSGIGQAKAREAAIAIGGKVLIPPRPGMDWNDYLTMEKK
ncbi:MAG TPA: toprim domain-containing protein [Nitrosomonas sp.]|nr:toprim domain-containing protein [Nitrosomonas sp.]